MLDYPVKYTRDNGTTLKGSDALWEHQKTSLKRSRNKAAFAFDYDPGLGKTATVIAEAGLYFLEGEIDLLIIDAPNRVHLQWILKAFPDWADFPWRGFAWPKGGLNSQKRKDAFARAMRVSEVEPALRVFAIDFENTRLPHGTRGRPAPVPDTLKLIHELVKTAKRGVYTVVDEAQRTKDWKAQQTRGVATLGRGISKVRRKLTGTPILQGVQDLYSQYAFLDHRIIGCKDFWAFRAQYCKTVPVPGGRPGTLRITGPKNLDQLTRRIAPFTARVKKADVFDMPAQIFSPFLVEMDPEQARHYANMETLMMTGLRSGKVGEKIITAQIVLTQLQKLLQIASGFIHDNDAEPVWLSDSKVDAIREKVDELGGEHCVIWAPFIPLKDRLAQVFPNATLFHELSDVDAWAKKGGPIIANPASGGVGVDGMQICHRAYYAANSFHLEHRLQSIERIHRGEQTRTCFYTDFLSIGTKDQTVLDVLKAKENWDRMTVEKLRKILLKD